MARERLPDPYSTGRRRRPSAAPAPLAGGAARERTPSLRALLLDTWVGRLFLAAAAAKILAAIWRRTGALPDAAAIVSALATLGLAIAFVWCAWRIFVMLKRRLLWRVRRKLILSYIFIGVIPALLILVFFLFAASLVFMNVSAYLFKDGYEAIVDDARVGAQAAASEIARNPAAAADTIDRVQRLRITKYPDVSVAYLPASGRAALVGPWRVMPPPALVPAWIKNDGFAGSIGAPVRGASGEETLVIRAVARIADASGGAVVVDVPLDAAVINRLHGATGVSLENVFSPSGGAASGPALSSSSTGSGSTLLFEKSLAELDVHTWTTGEAHRDTLALAYRLDALYAHLSTAQSVVVGGSGMRLADALMFMLVAIGVLFLIIEAVALVMGLALARSITSSVHQLFTGTERVRQGDFTTRIRIESRDQLGELAESFNQMTGSIENLLQTAAEKKRLEEELRIARQIQMSLLPRGPLEFPGIAVTALCVPAREVGGDYYDFFPLGDRQLGVLIADVSGKGTSAALYMAELKGLVLSLSQIYRSPRQLLMEVNRIISENLDTRSFITMTYGVLDMAEGWFTFARAGHTPMLYLPSDAGGTDAARVLAPSGIVVGLRIPGATEKFAELLEEDRVPIQRGDVFVLYTDGITEAMNGDSELFGDARLATLVSEHGHLETGALRERILREIESFVGGADQHDDMTMILIKIEEASAARAKVAV
ncbi:MAG TPA: PP2C family protein-serine/threonine phosphatase [Vicinamibacterales bacterium]|jgi:sigma-B regulation protein RsbU (phosphoserine phosphatase)